ncbi:MAG: diaminopimelate epimerase, partial [Lentisphaeria bacterium]|nr:diaminopimelate epimerase [Lentisphaeria bacterium]
MVFTKMHGAGNDFILVDDSELKWSRSPEFIAGICDRHLGVGGDGIIYLRKNDGGDVIRMDYYNSDGSGAVCGNGLRCSASFAYRKGLSGGKKRMVFLAGGNLLSAEVKDDAGAS